MIWQQQTDIIIRLRQSIINNDQTVHKNVSTENNQKLI